MTSSKHIMIVAGETSGDMHAAHLVHAIKTLDPTITFSGLGGPQMQKTGVEIYKDLTQIAVVGFFEVLKHFGEFKKSFELILEKVREQKPAAVILVDYPGFNLRLAKELKKLNTTVIYYISPQVWAWKENRVHHIKKYIDKMLVLFEFEKNFYARFGMDVTFVGHPLIDAVKIKTSREDFLRSQGLDTNKRTISLLPGSRVKEIEKHLPVMIEAAKILIQDFPDLQFIVVKAPNIPKSTFDSLSTFNFKLSTQPYDAINACDACLVSSGTATLEVALLEKPMVVIYKTSFLTWALAKCLVKIPNIGLVNVVAGKRIVPECVQFEATGQNIASELKNILSNPQKLQNIKTDLKSIKASLGSSGASHRAAQEILKTLFKSSQEDTK